MPFPSPSLAPPALSAYQLSYGGLVFGGVGGMLSSSPYQLQSLTMDMPDVASADVQRALDQGEFAGIDVLPGRDITLVQVVRAVAASVPLGAASLPALTNLVPDPSFEYDAAGLAPSTGLWVSGAGAGFTTNTFLVSNAWAARGSQSLHIQGTHDATSTSYQVFAHTPGGLSAMPVQPSTAYTAQASVYVVQAAGSGVRVQFNWWDNTGALISSSLGTLIGAGQTGTLAPTLTASSPSNAAFVSVFAAAVSAVPNQVVEFYLDAVIVQAAGSPVAYFDGDIPGYFWTGAKGNSASTNALPNPTVAAVTVDQAVQNLGGVLGPSGATEQPLYLQLPSGLFACMARPRKHQCPLDINRILAGATVATTLFHATDPRWYAAPSKQSVPVGLPTPAGGLTFDVTFDAGFGGGGVGGLVTVLNNGLFEMRPVLVITGACTNPVVSNLSIAGSPYVGVAITLHAGDTLVIDTDFQTVVYTAAGTTAGVSRRNALMAGSTWWNLPAGSSTIEFTTSNSTHVAGTLAVQSADAFLTV